VADFQFTRTFLRQLAEWEPSASAGDLEALDGAIASIAANPALPGRVPSYYDPAAPSYLFRAGTALIHFRPRPGGSVIFLNVFFQRP
jgi:hypothetical protein